MLSLGRQITVRCSVTANCKDITGRVFVVCVCVCMCVCVCARATAEPQHVSSFVLKQKAR